MSRLKKLIALGTSPAIWSYAVKAANALGSFIVTVLLARMAGAEAVGYYALAFTTATLIGLVPLWGFDHISVRAIAGDLRQDRRGEARGAWRWFLTIVTAAALPLALVFAALAAFGPMAQWLDADKGAMLAAAIGVLSVPLFRLTINNIRALGLPVHGQGFEAAPSLILAAILLAVAPLAIRPTAAMVTTAMFSLQLLASLVAIWLFYTRARHWGTRVAPDRALTRTWLIAGMPLMGTAFIHAFSDWFLVSAITRFASPADTGAFRVALQIMLIASVIVATAETYISPRIAGDIRIGRIDLVWKRHRRATLLMAVMAGPILLAAILFPEFILGTLFGPEFIVAAPALAFMTIGQASNVLTGPIGSVMIMSGHERIQFMLAIAGAALLMLLTLLLVPRYGLIGAGAGYAAALTIRNICSYLFARRLVRHQPAEH